MVGFIKGIFSKNKSEDAPKKSEVKKAEAKKSEPKKSKSDLAEKVPEKKVRERNAREALAFFLDADDAQTLGNVDYMRTAKTVRRTFPKTASQPEEQELNLQVSATKWEITNGRVETTNSTTSTPAAQPQEDPAAKRRQADSSMDMFRNMARDIKKK